MLWKRSLTASVPLGRHSENEALYDGRAQRARLHLALGSSAGERRSPSVRAKMPGDVAWLTRMH